MRFVAGAFAIAFAFLPTDAMGSQGFWRLECRFATASTGSFDQFDFSVGPVPERVLMFEVEDPMAYSIDDSGGRVPIEYSTSVFDASTFTEVLPTGDHQITVVDGLLNAVHYRHESGPSDVPIRVSQYYGRCEVEFIEN